MRSSNPIIGSRKSHSAVLKKEYENTSEEIQVVLFQNWYDLFQGTSYGTFHQTFAIHLNTEPTYFSTYEYKHNLT